MLFHRSSASVGVAVLSLLLGGFFQTTTKLCAQQTGDNNQNWVMLAADSETRLVRFHCLTDVMLLEEELLAISLESSSLSCCALIQTAMQHLRVLHHNVLDDSAVATDDTIQDDCVQNIVQVPLLPSGLQPTSLFPTHSFFYSRASSNSTTHDRSTAGEGPSSTAGRPEDWKLYLFNGRTATLHDISKSEFPNELQSLRNDNSNDESPPSPIAREDSFFRALLVSSELSQSGGMHRLWYQRIQLGKDAMIPADRSMNQLQLYLVMHIPPDFFLDTEDVFEYDKNKLQLDLVTLHNDTVIDIEEPAFVSPGHAVLVRVTKTNLQPNDEFLEFAIKIHLRYPQPVVDRHQSGAFRKVWLPAPVLVAGCLEWHKSQHEDDAAEKHAATATTIFRLSPWSATIVFLPDQQQHAPMLETWVAAGDAQDFLPVLCITLIVAVAGAAIMMRDIWRVATWDR